MIYLILLLSLMLRMINLNQSFWLDEGTEVMALKENDLSSLITRYSIGDFHPPFYHLVLFLWTKVFGISEVIVRFPSVLFGVGTVWLTYLIGKETGHKKLGKIGALFVALSPLHIYYSQEARMYSATAFLAALSIYFFLKLFSEDKAKNYFFYLSATVLMLYTDYMPYFLIPFQYLYLFWQRKKLKKPFLKKWLFGQMIILVSILPWLPFFLKQIKVGMTVASYGTNWGRVIGGIGLKEILLVPIKFSLGRTSFTDKMEYGLVSFLVLILFGFLLLKNFFSSEKKSAVFLFLWFLTPLFSVAIISIFIPIFSYFRLLFLLVPFSLLLGRGIILLKEKFYVNLLIVTTSVILLTASFTYFVNPLFQREDWRSAARLVESRKNDGAAVLFLSGRPFDPYRFYSQNKIKTYGIYGGLSKIDKESLKKRLSEIIYSYKSVFLFEYLGDPVVLEEVVNFLSENNLKQEKIFDFPGVGLVYLFERS